MHIRMPDWMIALFSGQYLLDALKEGGEDVLRAASLSSFLCLYLCLCRSENQGRVVEGPIKPDFLSLDNLRLH